MRTSSAVPPSFEKDSRTRIARRTIPFDEAGFGGRDRSRGDA